MATLTKKEKLEQEQRAKVQLKMYYGFDLVSRQAGEMPTLYISTHYTGNTGTALSRVMVITDDGKIADITHLVARASGLTLRDKDGRGYIRTGGYGYNRALHITHNLSMVLFRDTYSIGYTEI